MLRVPRIMSRAPRITIKAPRIMLKAPDEMKFNHLRHLWLSIKYHQQPSVSVKLKQ
jgi:hypothetical protein